MSQAHVVALQRAWPARAWWVCFAVCLVTALAIHGVTLVSERIGARADIAAHVRWAYQFSLALNEGQWVPRWLSQANGGLGEPTFVVLHPGYYYVVSGLQAFGLGLWPAIQVAGVLATFLLGLTTVWALRSFLTPYKACLAALLMATLPFIVFLFALYEALPWHFAFPFVVLAVRLSLPGLPGYGRFDVRLALVVALMVLVHLMVAFMVLLCLTAVELAAWLRRAGWQRRWRDPMVGWMLSVALGMGLSAYYWLLAGTSQSLFRHWTDVDGMFRSSFALPFVTSALFGMRWPAIQWVLPLPSLAMLVATVLLLRQRSGSTPTLAQTSAKHLAVIAAAGLFMASELAFPIYWAVPPLQAVQFPYRFLTVSDVAGALALALALLPQWRQYGAKARGAAVATVAFSVVLSAVMLVKQHREGVRPDTQALLTGDIGTAYSQPSTIGPEWKRYVEAGSFIGFCERQNLRCTTVQEQPHARTWLVEADATTRVLLPLFAFPAWRIQVNGSQVPADIDVPTGVIQINVPAGVNKVEVRWQALWQERAGTVISGVSLAILAAAMVLTYRRR